MYTLLLIETQRTKDILTYIYQTGIGSSFSYVSWPIRIPKQFEVLFLRELKMTSATLKVKMFNVVLTLPSLHSLRGTFCNTEITGLTSAAKR